MTQAPEAQSAQTVPYLINFQGRLTNTAGTTVANGDYNIRFTLYDALTGGTNRWQGSRVYGASDYRVTVTNGLFNVQFGTQRKATQLSVPVSSTPKRTPTFILKSNFQRRPLPPVLPMVVLSLRKAP
ncbi:hypothetical protein IPG36_06730 [bacterium]|nr:MAG: hypothetical protein IPG36_06730 [bacterium]